MAVQHAEHISYSPLSMYAVLFVPALHSSVAKCRVKGCVSNETLASRSKMAASSPAAAQAASAAGTSIPWKCTPGILQQLPVDASGNTAQRDVSVDPGMTSSDHHICVPHLRLLE